MGRPTVHGVKVILKGDKTSHGGEVITASKTRTYEGIGVARKGDLARCPKCHGTFEIIEGSSASTDRGIPIALHGHKLECGAELIAG